MKLPTPDRAVVAQRLPSRSEDAAATRATKDKERRFKKLAKTMAVNLPELETAIALGWRKPVDGGRVATYRIQRRRAGKGGWEDVATSIATQVELERQERGVEYEYRVLAVNQAGVGPPSATVRAVL